MFKIVANPTFKHKLRVAVPIDGGHRDETMEATYRVLGTDEMEAFDLNTAEGTTDFLKAAVDRVDDLVNEAGEPISWNSEIRDQLLRIPYVRLALSRGYFEGVIKARPGN